MKSFGAGRVLMALAAGWAVMGAAPAEKGPRPAVPFIADDYPGALARAKAKKLPIFVEAWAPW